MLIFNARDLQYKSPIRAVATDEPVHLRLVVSRDMHCSGARLVVTKDGETPVPYGMFWAGMCGTEAGIGNCILPLPPLGCIFIILNWIPPGDCILCATPGAAKGIFCRTARIFSKRCMIRIFKRRPFCGAD